MENLDGTTLFWLITAGMLIGSIAKVVMWNKGLTITSNILAGILGTVIIGGFGIELEIPGSMMFGVLGGMAIIFIANVFFVQDEHEATEH